MRGLDRGETETKTTEWVWVTTLPATVVPTTSVVHWGHRRWDIENYGFNESVQGWDADPVYKHDPHAVEGFLLTVVLAYNLFDAWLTRNLKPSIQRGRSQVFWARLMAAEIYGAAAVAIRSP
ncbi:MAG TPA: transposase [Terriglobia bacterium]|nr:transposase [Terriglobia bacterium]